MGIPEAGETAIKMFQVRGEGSLTQGRGSGDGKGQDAGSEPTAQRMLAYGSGGVGRVGDSFSSPGWSDWTQGKAPQYLQEVAFKEMHPQAST